MKRLATLLVPALALAALLSACGAPRQPLMMNPNYYPAYARQVSRFQAQRPVPYQAYGRPMQAFNQSLGTVRGSLTPTRPKEESKLVERNVSVPRSAFDDALERSRGRVVPSDPFFRQPKPRPPQAPPAGEMPYATWADLKDQIRYGFSTVFEDTRFMNEANARKHFERFIPGSYRELQKLYKLSREDMKRLILLDTLANSLEAEGQTLAWADVHQPAPGSRDRLSLSQAIALMPSFGELVAYNRSSMDVNYAPWNLAKAARHYQSNYPRYIALMLENAPGKQEAWRAIHRELSSIR